MIGPVGPGVLGDLPSRPLEGLADDVDADLLVRIGRGQLVERGTTTWFIRHR